MFLELFTFKPNIQNSIRIYEPPCTEPTKQTSLSMSIKKKVEQHRLNMYIFVFCSQKVK